MGLMGVVERMGIMGEDRQMLSKSMPAFISVLAVMVTAITGCQTTAKHVTMAEPARVDSAKGVASADAATTWYDALDIGVEGQGWHRG